MNYLVSSSIKETPKKRRFGDGTPGPGRPKGVPNKNTASIKAAFVEAFDELGGAKALAKWAVGNPTEFYKLASKLIPTEVKAKVDGGLVVQVMMDGDPDARP